MASSIDILKKVAWEGILNRYGSKPSKAVKDRFDREMVAIIKANFVDYLLLLWDLYTFMDEVQIPYGPGRGSSAASIVCYALGITGVCPLEYDLLFERFLNVERVSVPDVDLDISANRRGEVIDYLKKRWGEERVSQIITFGTFGGRAAIRDMARTLYGRDNKEGLKLAGQLANQIARIATISTMRSKQSKSSRSFTIQISAPKQSLMQQSRSKESLRTPLSTQQALSLRINLLSNTRR